jgi:hypothetical protein
MLFGNKKDMLINVCQNLADNIIRSKNSFKPIIISDTIRAFVESKNPSLVKEFIKTLKNDNLENKNPNIDELYKHIKNRSLLIVVGDFLGDFDFKLLSKKHEVFVVIIRDEFEENPKVLGDRNFIDLPTKNSYNFHFGKKELAEWKKGYEKNDKTLISHLNSLGISYGYL